MARISHLRVNVIVVAVFGVLIAIAAFFVFGGGGSETGDAPGRKPLGSPQLASVHPLSKMDGAMYRWVPASASTSLLAAVASSATEARTAVEINRAPVRGILDTYPSYSAVGVDIRSDEVFLQDENLFGVKVFNRLDNTPPQASFSEPKRVLGGNKTKLEYNCSIYIDPKNGDIYSLANDTVANLVVFPHDAKGNVAPMREFATPQATFGFAVDEEHQEIFIAVEMTHSIVVYNKMASGKEIPLREIVGDSTQLADPHGVAVDSKNDLLFVNNAGGSYSWKSGGEVIPGSGKFSPPSITVYPRKASGNTPPLRVIAGPKTQLNWTAGMYLDQERAELYVANDGGDSILVFRETDSGDVAPLRVLKGSKTGLKNPTGVFADQKHQELWVANLGNHTATVYPLTANGDVAPLRTIRSAPPGQLSLAFANPAALAYDSRRDEILVVN